MIVVCQLYVSRVQYSNARTKEMLKTRVAPECELTTHLASRSVRARQQDRTSRVIKSLLKVTIQGVGWL